MITLLMDCTGFLCNGQMYYIPSIQIWACDECGHEKQETQEDVIIRFIRENVTSQLDKNKLN